MPDNQFSVAVPNALQALMQGEQGYKDVRGMVKENTMSAVREQAAQDVMQGGDPKSALARLLSVGDDKGAATLAGVIHNQQTADYQNRSLDVTGSHYKALEGQSAAQLAESARHNRALEGQSAEAANKPMILPAGSGLVDRKGNVLREPSMDAALDPDTITAMAHQLRAGDTSVLTNLGRGAQGAANVIAVRRKVAELNGAAGETGTDQANRNAEFGGVKAGQRTLGTKQANIELAATEFKQVIPIVQAASDAVDRTRFSDLNKIIQSGQSRTGDPNIVKFGSGVNTLINLYARAISPSGVPTVSDKDHARDILQVAWSKGQFNAAVGMMQSEIDAALQSPEKVREEMRARFKSGINGSPSLAAPTAAPKASGLPPPPPGFQVVQ